MATQTDKYYTLDYIQNQFRRMSKNKQVSTLYEALGYMQQYNGRSKWTCIAMTMGYENWEGGVDTYTKNNK